MKNNKPIFKVIIAGSRQFYDYSLLKEKCLKILSDKLKDCDIQIICGCARGTDTIGKQFAEEFGFKVLEYPADWEKYGKSAGYRRNKEMAKVADALIAFWDGESRGTKHMIDLAKEYGLPTRIIYYKKYIHSKKQQ